jgi:hypothetical protein
MKLFARMTKDPKWIFEEGTETFVSRRGLMPKYINEVRTYKPLT